VLCPPPLFFQVSITRPSFPRRCSWRAVGPAANLPRRTCLSSRVRKCSVIAANVELMIAARCPCLLAPVRWSILQQPGAAGFPHRPFSVDAGEKIFRKLPLMFRNRRKPLSFSVFTIANRVPLWCSSKKKPNSPPRARPPALQTKHLKSQDRSHIRQRLLDHRISFTVSTAPPIYSHLP